MTKMDPSQVAQLSRRPVGPQNRVAAMAVVVALSLAGCASPRAEQPQPFQGEYPGLLRPAEVLGQDVVLRQRVTAAWNDGEGQSGSRGFEAVVQKQGSLLTMVGLSPFGSVGFAILLENGQVELRHESGEELPFPPRFVLLDFQRVFYPWVAEAGEALPDGEHRAVVGGEEVHEEWLGGRLIERRFRRLDDQPPGELLVHYTWESSAPGAAGASASAPGSALGSAPSRAVLDNTWFRYKLTVDTLQETLLEAAGNP
ncbi:MAG: hypothetical protein ACI9EF_003914 [Pseudohongiellaceae bacterium]|jgi:hypothetical protein